jgi:hypothetical protein
LIRSYFYTLLRRSIGFWLGVRLILSLLAGLGRGAGLLGEGSASQTGIALSVMGSGLVVLLVIGLLLFDNQASGEALLVANFGVSQVQVALIAGVVVFLLELSVVTLRALLM